jgi:L-ascorbate metabolism protein UlaG (beta-lactamase superfamily)
MDITNFITYCGHASFLMKGAKTIYIDPYKLKKAEKADLVFITHGHYDHLSVEDIKKVAGKNTAIVSPVQVNGFNNVTLVKPNTEYTVNGIHFKTVPAFNVKLDRRSFHPKPNNGVGYVIDFEGRKVYHAGDTDFIEEMKYLGEIDIALLPMGGTYTMDVLEAVQAANTIKAKVSVPMHYKSLLASRAKDAEDLFKTRVPNSVIMQEN